MGPGLEKWGWSRYGAGPFEEYRRDHDTAGVEPGRVILRSAEIYRVGFAEGEIDTRVRGRLRDRGALPAVGDWVVLQRHEARIVDLLPRRSCIARKVAGERSEPQVVAANVDTLLLFMGLDGDLNLRRLERLLVMARDSGAEPVVVLTKSDLCPDVGDRRETVSRLAGAAPVFAISALAGEGLEPLRFYLEDGATVALVGSSGAGKSTFVNAVCGAAVMRTGAVREGDDRGRHTTTHRQLIALPQGGLLIDNPGIREIQLWLDDADSLEGAFDEIAELAGGCRFRDCRHQDEPGCAVRRAVDEGRLEAARLDSLQRLQREVAALDLRRDEAARRRQDKRQGKLYKRIQQRRRRERGFE